MASSLGHLLLLCVLLAPCAYAQGLNFTVIVDYEFCVPTSSQAVWDLAENTTSELFIVQQLSDINITNLCPPQTQPGDAASGCDQSTLSYTVSQNPDGSYLVQNTYESVSTGAGAFYCNMTITNTNPPQPGENVCKASKAMPGDFTYTVVLAVC
eukprot:TRINITY_DN14752_c0_g1_i1.p1 TRINITY_DN14752_c0_g1~~TRINITY_DN14752_c0_g1_i1.p1  ORF type:complete len:175 (-),score=7.90 TRINITY_DN14752_c0_g1_i1:66-527(-)